MTEREVYKLICKLERSRLPLNVKYASIVDDILDNNNTNNAVCINDEE